MAEPSLSLPNGSLFDRLAVGHTPPTAAEPVAFVIFGGGALAHRKLLPALCNLHLDGQPGD